MPDDGDEVSPFQAVLYGELVVVLVEDLLRDAQLLAGVPLVRPGHDGPGALADAVRRELPEAERRHSPAGEHDR